MPPVAALSVARALRDELLACGVPQVSIELQTGRSSRWVSTGTHGGTSFVANLGHHTASFPSASNPTPSLGVVKDGRPGIPGPLCNGYGGMDLIARIICLDWANHPGEGGPWTIDGYTVPRDGGRPYLFGWEHEGGFSEAVWDATYTNHATGKRMTYREFMGRCHAGTLRWLGRPRTSHGEHATWADKKQVGRKIDRLGYRHPVDQPATKGINELTPYYLGPLPEDDVTPEDIENIATAVWHRLTGYTHSDPNTGEEYPQKFWHAVRDNPELSANAVWWQESGLTDENGDPVAMWQLLRRIDEAVQGLAQAQEPLPPAPAPTA